MNFILYKGNWIKSPESWDTAQSSSTSQNGKIQKLNLSPQKTMSGVVFGVEFKFHICFGHTRVFLKFWGGSWLFLVHRRTCRCRLRHIQQRVSVTRHGVPITSDRTFVCSPMIHTSHTHPFDCFLVDTSFPKVSSIRSRCAYHLGLQWKWL